MASIGTSTTDAALDNVSNLIRSMAHKKVDGLNEPAGLGVRPTATVLACRMWQLAIEYPQPDGCQGGSGRRDLHQELCTWSTVFDHALQPADLTLDLPQTQAHVR